LRDVTSRVGTAQGSPAPHRRLVTTTTASVSPCWITPTCRTSDTPCRSPAPAAVWMGQRLATIREARRPQAPSLASPSAEDESSVPCGRTSSPGPRRRSVTRLEGPPRADTRESIDSQPHPGCLPPLGPSASFRETPVRCLAALVSHRWSDNLGTFVTSDNKDPDEVECVAGSASPDRDNRIEHLGRLGCSALRGFCV